MIKTFHVCSATLALFLSFSACQQGASNGPDAASVPTSATEPSPSTLDASGESAAGAPVAGESESGEVDFEPAYPTEVSSEGLSSEDTAQQAVEHSHDGGEAHTHDDASGHDAEEGHGDHDH